MALLSAAELKTKKIVELNDLAKKIGEPVPLKTVTSLETLKGSVFFENYEQWAAWLDQPSNADGARCQPLPPLPRPSARTGRGRGNLHRQREP